MKRQALVIAACAVGLLRPAAAAPPDAPLRLETGGAFGALFLEVTAADARALDRPEHELRWAFANDWSNPMVVARGGDLVLFQTDLQTDWLALSSRWPWSRLFGPGPALGGRPLWERLSTAVEARASLHWGGWSDGPIEGWHRLIHADDFERPRYPRNMVRATLQDERTGAGIALRSTRPALGDVVLRTQLLVAEGGASVEPGRARWAISTRLDVKVPAGRPAALGGSGGWDGGAALLGTVELAPWMTLHALAAASAFSPIDLPVPLQPRTWHYTGELSLVVRVWGFAAIIEDRLTTAIFQGGWQPMSAGSSENIKSSGYYGAFLPQNRVSGGLRRGAWTLWFSEDWTPGRAPYAGGGADWFHNSNAPDIAIGVVYLMGE